MPPSRPRLAPAFVVAVLGPGLALPLRAQSRKVETVHLPDGKTYQVAMAGGRPIPVPDQGQVEVKVFLEASRDAQSTRYDPQWRFTVFHPERILRAVQIRPFSAEGRGIRVDLEGPRDGGVRRAHQGVELRGLNRRAFPTLWKGFDEGDAFWAGFEIQVWFEEAGVPPQTFPCFVKLWGWEVDKVRGTLGDLAHQVAGARKEHPLVLPDGELAPAITVDGRVERAPNEAMGVVALTPALLPDPGNPGSARLVWTLEGRLHWPGPVALKVTSPLAPGVEEAATLPERGRFTLRFGSPDRCPGLWTWVAQPGETWWPFRLSAQGPKPEQTLTWIEWVHLPPEAKARLRALLGAPAPGP